MFLYIGDSKNVMKEIAYERDRVYRLIGASSND